MGCKITKVWVDEAINSDKYKEHPMQENVRLKYTIKQLEKELKKEEEKNGIYLCDKCNKNIGEMESQEKFYDFICMDCYQKMIDYQYDMRKGDKNENWK